MANTFKNGDHLQQYGGYQGIAYQNGKWIKYECSGCALASGLSKAGHRLSTADHSIIWNRYFINKPVAIKHDKALHNEWLKNGKPV